MPFFSIIVPVYNSSQYLHRCIDSILNQTYRDFECILVDDGSTDSSGSICDEYVQKDKRVRVFHKKNGGVSSARNKGIKEAKGKYVIFVDSDDYILNDKLEKNYIYCKNLSDMIVGFYIVPKSYLYNKHEVCESDFNYINDIGVVWTSLFRTDILKTNNILFDEHIWHGEDSIFILNYFYYCENITFIDEYGYVYEKGHENGLNVRFQSCTKELYTYEKLRKYRYEICKKNNFNIKSYNNIKKGEIIRVIKSIYIGEERITFYKRISFIKSISTKYNKKENITTHNITDLVIIKCLYLNLLLILDLYMNLWKRKYTSKK